MRPATLNLLNRFVSILIRLNLLICIIAIVAIAAAFIASADIPYEASIPPFGATQEPETKCENYIATDFMRRVETWLYTFQTGLLKSPDIETDMWECIMDMENIVATDDFVLTACTNDPNEKFITLARKALDRHLDLCGAKAAQR